MGLLNGTCLNETCLNEMCLNGTCLNGTCLFQSDGVPVLLLQHQEDVQKSKLEYSRLMERLRLDRAKYLDVQNKGTVWWPHPFCKVNPTPYLRFTPSLL